jgi:hypothetical protein
VLKNSEAEQLIRSRIESGEPWMVSRFSTCEMNVLNAYRQRNRAGVSKRLNRLLTGVPVNYTDKVRFQARNNAGIFPETDAGLDRFAQITLKSCEQIDLLGIWSRPLKLEEKLYRERCPSATLIPLQAIEPYYHPSPWSSALNGKKVLVIHPFEESIRKQYIKRELLFFGTEVLPEFELKTIKAVQSAAGSSVEFKSWVEAFESMKAQVEQMDFDVALIGAGAYGLPLAAHVKDLGKQAVHMGGALQIFFGIKGGRWDENPEINRFYNEHWTRPLAEETPAQSGQVEEGCYW